MRVTNNMIINKANTNINNNKIAVDKGNTQMTTQKKIDRPSEDPVIAVRSLRLQTALGKIDQYYERNIPDADAWMDITETALLNINENMKEFRTLCVNGATGTLTQDDRKTILQQLQSLQESIFSQGNADYAGRTVLTGYRTNKNLVFTKNETQTNYNITEQLSADNMEKVRYYNGVVTVPTNESEIQRLQLNNTDTVGAADLNKSVFTNEKSEYNRLRLGYDSVQYPGSMEFSYTDKDGVKHGLSLPLSQATWKTEKNGASDEATTTNAKYQYTVDKDGTISKDGVALADNEKLPSNSLNEVTYSTAAAKDGDIISRSLEGDANRVGLQSMTYTDPTDATKTTTFNYQEVETGADPTADPPSYFPEKVYVFENEDDWAMWSSAQAGNDGKKIVPDDSMVLIKSTGDLVFGDAVASKMQSTHMNVEVNYDKTGFDNGDLRPEYYYNCVDWSDNKNRTVYNVEDNDYDIQYTIAQNLELTVNLQAWDVFNSDVQQDMKDMTACVSRCIDAADKLSRIEQLQKDPSYQSTEDQAKLAAWHELAQREYDNANDDMDKLFSTALGKSDDYYDKINLAITKLGCMKDQLQMTERRMDEQQQTVTDLQSKNDNLDLSEIVINYTASYTAYQSSLQAAGRLGQQSLLNYI